MEYLKKIAIAAVAGKIGKMKEGDAPRQLARVVGIANSTGTIETNFGTSIFINGTIRAVNLETGEEFQSAKAYLPDLVVDPIHEQLKLDPDTPVQFAFDVGVKFSAKGSTGYEFTVKPLIDTSASDPLKELLGKLPALQLTKAAESEKEVKEAKNGK